MAFDVNWHARSPYVPHGSDVKRFGHSITAVDARDDWGTEILVLYGGVVQAPTLAGDPSPEHTLQHQHVACGDVLVLQVESDTWFAPDMMAASCGPSSVQDMGGEHHDADASQLTPGPRAFHAAAAVGTRVYVFGGHVLPSGGDPRAKRRIFFADLWSLDTVSCKLFRM